MKNRDKRTRLMTELLNNIKRSLFNTATKSHSKKIDCDDSIKLYAWEFSFMRKILDTRNNQELKMLRKIGILMVRIVAKIHTIAYKKTKSFNIALWTGIPLVVAFSSFAVAAITSSRPLTADIIFPAISLFMLLQFPLAMVLFFENLTSLMLTLSSWVK